MPSNSIYREYGYIDRDDYLDALAQDYNTPIENVKCLAEILGPEEDFDGLVSTLDGM
jgi:hypothetical protein